MSSSANSNPFVSAVGADCAMQLAQLTDFHTRTFEGVRLLIDLNISHAQAPQDARKLTGVIDRLHAEFACCIEECVTEANRKLAVLIESAVAGTPADATAPTVIAFLQQKKKDADFAYERFQQALQQARAALAEREQADDTSRK